MPEEITLASLALKFAGFVKIMEIVIDQAEIDMDSQITISAGGNEIASIPLQTAFDNAKNAIAAVEEGQPS